MRTFTFKGLFLTVLFMLLGSTAILAADDGLITKQITLTLDKAGTLPNRIPTSKKNLITNLKIVGEVNGTDWLFIREMAGWDFKMNETPGKLSILDLSEARIVEGGSAYVSYKGYIWYTSNDKLSTDAFYGCSGLKSLTIPSSVTSIGSGAFENCSGLTSLTIPSGVTSIGNYAFENCSGLTSLTIPSSVTSIGDEAFRDCSGLTSLTIPSSITSIGKRAFLCCSGLTNLTIPSSVTSIGWYAFAGCSGLTSLTIPSSVTSIGSGAFENCSGLTSLTIPSSVTEIGSEAFEGCSGLTSLTLPSSVTGIGYQAFQGCSGLTSLTIPSSVTYIGDQAFQGCSGLTNLTIPSSVTSIDDGVFAECTGLTSIYIYAEKVSELWVENMFKGCDAKNCTVYVPKGTYDAYKSSSFGYFEKIVEFDATGIDKVTTYTNAKEVSRYSANGQRLSALAKGLNIVKYSDGSVKKVVVQ